MVLIYPGVTTGDTAGNYIRRSVIQRAKSELATGVSNAQVAYGLGFKYAQHQPDVQKTYRAYPIGVWRQSS